MLRPERVLSRTSCVQLRQRRCRTNAAKIHCASDVHRLHYFKSNRQAPRSTLDYQTFTSCTKLRALPGNRNNASDRSESTATSTVQVNEERQEQLIKQLKESRSQMSHRLSDANQYISYLEHRMEDGNQAMHEAFRIMQKVIDELDALSCLTVSVAASLKFAVDEDESIHRLNALQKRLNVTHKALEEEKNTISNNCPRTVPITWVGVAQEVRIMGDFDGWTRGKELSAEEISEQVMSEFTVTLELLPGRYEFKLLINDEWKLTDAFPTTTNEAGVTNNLLIVD